MNKIERIVYNLVRGNPAVKKKLRNLYQSVFDVLPLASLKAAYPIVERKGYFFGFHDVTPFSQSGTKLLANCSSFDLRMPEESDFLEVGYFDGDDFLKFHPIARTSAWNWHMGCRLQWRGQSNEMVFNDLLEGQCVSRIVDISSGNETVLPDAISSISPDGRWAIGYSYTRVEACMPGYGYKGYQQRSSPMPNVPPDTGIYVIDVEKCSKELLISLAELAEIKPSETMEGAIHFVTHAQISPDSSRAMFLHRWIDPKGDMDRRFSRLVVIDRCGTVLDIFETQEMVSHIGWKDSDHVVAYCRVLKYDDQYVVFKVGEPGASVVVGQNCFSSDGHPSFERHGRYMLTDTYPDRRRCQGLVIYDVVREVRYDLAIVPSSKAYQSPSRYQHWSCDLHPRWSPDGSILSFDATFSGCRSLCTMNIGNALSNEDLKYVNRTLNGV